MMFEMLGVYSVCKIPTNENFIRIFFHDGWIALVKLYRKNVFQILKNLMEKNPRLHYLQL
jgi:hypothetical protein